MCEFLPAAVSFAVLYTGYSGCGLLARRTIAENGMAVEVPADGGKVAFIVVGQRTTQSRSPSPSAKILTSDVRGFVAAGELELVFDGKSSPSIGRGDIAQEAR